MLSFENKPSNILSHLTMIYKNGNELVMLKSSKQQINVAWAFFIQQNYDISRDKGAKRN